MLRPAEPTSFFLLRAVARGHKWFEELPSSRAGFAREIAARERVSERFVRRLIPLAFLSPSIVEAIADGRQQVSFTAEALSRGIDISPDWDRQLAALGFDPAVVT
jgi:site-specific DNA recombinase